MEKKKKSHPLIVNHSCGHSVKKYFSGSNNRILQEAKRLADKKCKACNAEDAKQIHENNIRINILNELARELQGEERGYTQFSHAIDHINIVTNFIRRKNHEINDG